jgi:type IV pilus assembly protein PilC
MATVFYYRARAADGVAVNGSMEAESADQVLANLRTRALFVTAIDRSTDRWSLLRHGFRLRSPGNAAMLAFYRSFAMLIRSGVSIQRSLNIVIERTENSRLREALRASLTDVESGASLSVAFARHPREFAPLQVAMVSAGEAGGVLDEVLERIATLLEKERGLRKKIQSALAYPIVVLTAAMSLVLFLMIKVIPMFSDMFASFHADLPPLTRLMIEAGVALSRPWAWCIAALAAVAGSIAVRLIAETAPGGLALDAARLSIPYVGALIRKATTARIARMLGCLLRSGVTLLASIEVAIPVTGSRRFAAAFESVHAALREGDSFSRPLRAQRLFDPLFIALVGVGEETGSVDEMLMKIAEYFDADIDAAIATLGAVLEPVLVVFLGGIVGLIVLSVFLPLYSLIGSINR